MYLEYEGKDVTRPEYPFCGLMKVFYIKFLRNVIRVLEKFQLLLIFKPLSAPFKTNTRTDTHIKEKNPYILFNIHIPTFWIFNT